MQQAAHSGKIGCVSLVQRRRWIEREGRRTGGVHDIGRSQAKHLFEGTRRLLIRVALSTERVASSGGRVHDMAVPDGN